VNESKDVHELLPTFFLCLTLTLRVGKTVAFSKDGEQ